LLRSYLILYQQWYNFSMYYLIRCNLSYYFDSNSEVTTSTPAVSLTSILMPMLLTVSALLHWTARLIYTRYPFRVCSICYSNSSRISYTVRQAKQTYVSNAIRSKDIIMYHHKVPLSIIMFCYLNFHQQLFSCSLMIIL
jgi:hypothetical protein